MPRPIGKKKLKVEISGEIEFKECFLVLFEQEIKMKNKNKRRKENTDN